MAQPAQAPAQYQPQQQPPSTYVPTPLYNNNNAGGMKTFMQSAPNTMTPHLIISGMQGLEDLLEVWVEIEGWVVDCLSAASVLVVLRRR